MRKKVSKNWWYKISKEEIEQEELIQLWKHPDLEGYQGLLAYKELYYTERNKNRSEIPLKKNTPAKSAGVSILEYNLFDFLDCYSENLRGKVSLLLQGVLENLIYGTDIQSIRDLSKKLKVSKSSFGRLRSCLVALLLAEQSHHK